MTPTALPYEERLRLMRELEACTHTCRIEGCDNEAKHTCVSHPLPGWDGETDYDEAGICDTHWGHGFDSKCASCQPEYGPHLPPSKIMQYCTRKMLEFLENRICSAKIAPAAEDSKTGVTIMVKKPQRWAGESQ